MVFSYRFCCEVFLERFRELILSAAPALDLSRE